MDDEAAFSAFVRARSGGLRRTAWLLTGEWASADDLVQTALMRVWQRWSAIEHAEAAEAYTRRTVFRVYLGWRRRRWTGELALGWVPEQAEPGDIANEHAERSVVLAALARLPRQQRAVVVLRYFDDLSEQDAAVILGCSVGAVKTHAARARRTLRADSTLVPTIKLEQP